MTAKAAAVRPRYAEVAPDIPLLPTARQVFTYAVPTNVDVQPHTQVVIPFGPREVTGVVITLHERPTPYRAKPLATSLPWQLTSEQFAFAEWLCATAQGGLGFTLRLFFPPGQRTARPAEKRSATALRLATAKDRAALQALRDGSCAFIEAQVVQRRAQVAAIARAAAEAAQQLPVVVPERWMVAPYVAALTKEGVAAVGMHAGLSSARQAEVWGQVQRGDWTVVVGTQKALFLPYQKLAGVVIEEEFLPTHKLWDQYPRLHNVYGARTLARLHGCHVYYATSSASLALRHDIAEKKVAVLRDAPVRLRPHVIAPTLADRHTRQLLPEDFVRQVRRAVARGKSVLILHNARGAWRAALCRRCHAAARCQTCGAAMTLPSAARRRLQCPMCGTQRSLALPCSACGKGTLAPVGLGLEKLSDILSQLLPAHVQVVRADAAQLKHAATSKALAQAQVIVATSAIFAQAPERLFDTVVYAFPEWGLLYPDYRSTERTHTLLTRLQQRVRKAGILLLLTRRPQLVEEMLMRTPRQYTAAQLRERRRLHYPPFQDLVLLTARAPTAAKARARAVRARRILDERQAAANLRDVQVRGPFTNLKKATRGSAEAHILFIGPLATLQPLYQQLPIDVVDVAPERIL